MKKLILIPFLFLAIVGRGQNIILQNVVSEFKGSVSICADTTEHEDYGCQILQTIDSIAVCPEYTAFVSLCNTLTGHTTTSFVCQLTEKQTFDPTNPQRIIIRYKDAQKIVNYDTLTITQKVIYNNFINKVKKQF